MSDWHAKNHRWLVSALAALRANETLPEPAEMDAPPALLRLAETFGLSPFERDLLLLTAGVELDGEFGAAYGVPTFGLALEKLRGSHWSAVSPGHPLRRWRMIELLPSGPLTSRPLQIDERVLNHLIGVDHVDQRLADTLYPASSQDGIATASPRTVVTPSQQAVVAAIVAAWSAAGRRGEPLPLIQLRGVDRGAKAAIARQACDEVGLALLTLSVAAPFDDSTLALLITRELRLASSALMIVADDVEPSPAVARWLERSTEPVILSTCEQAWTLGRPIVSLDVEKPLASEQLVLWGEALPALECGELEPIVSQFDLGALAIRAAAANASAAHGGVLQDAVWDACRRLSRPKLEGLAQRIAPRASWDDLVVPKALRELLELVATHVKMRARVHEAWKFTRRNSRGLGITALFSGPSGTGKTLAAEVLASELRLDLYRVDLSQVVSKYIGETEKNLRRVFDAAEEGSAVLLFDEADALFGKRGDVKDSLDRYANMEVSYLLQRMETYRGLAILTTNMKTALDPAFLRRLQFVAQFPFPNVEQRLAIWSRFFPNDANVAEDLDRLQLAQLNLAGGSIYNVARNAAFLAAAAERPLSTEHVHRAARDEFTKLERPSNLPRTDT